MRIRTRKNLRKKNTMVSVLFLLPLIGFGAYASFLVYIIMDVSSYTFLMDPPDTDYFYDLDEIDMEILHQIALKYEKDLEQFHMPANISVEVTFTDYTYSEEASWSGTDNGNLHVGYSLLAMCNKYKWALDNDEKEHLENATRIIKKLVTAFSNFMAAPNGGLGINPETREWYPGTLARFAVPPGYEDIHPFMFENHPRHFNGTGDYKNWRIRLHTSRDELAGFYIGTASVLKFVDRNHDEESKWIWDRTKLIVSQMIEGFKRTNWLMIGAQGETGPGVPCGSDLNSYGEGSMWQLTLLRIGATADPEAYESLYHYSAAKIMNFRNAVMGSPLNTIQETYALSFGVAVEYALILLEDNPQLRYYYIKNFETGFYSYVRYHRNNFYNIAHLIFMELLNKDQRKQFRDEKHGYNDDKIIWDVLDNLWRFHTSGWGEGVRNYNLTDRPHSTRATSLNPEIRKMERVPLMKEWRAFFENNPYGTLYKWVYDSGFIEFREEKEIYMLPLTVSEYGIHHWGWEHNKFRDTGGNPTGDGLTQAAPNSFLAIYWMGKAYNIF